MGEFIFLVKSYTLEECMQFIVQGYDGTDDGALERRMAVREAHLKMAKEYYERGKWLFAAALLNDAGNMIGSIIMCEFSSQNELQEQWLHHEPYILENVWKKIEINKVHVAPFCLKK
jgi:uncharacterized protein YciI